MRNYIITFSFLFSFLLTALSCDKKDENPPIPPTSIYDTIEDLRSSYKVSTLTQTFDGSGGLTVDADGFIYVANFGDQLNNANGKKVSRVDPNTGEVSEFANGLLGASGNAFDSKGNLFQANIKGNTISKITPQGDVTTFATEGFSSPVGITIDKDDNLYVCNCVGNSIRKVSPDGTSTAFASSNLLTCPNGITIDENGNLYPVNFNNGSLLKITPDGTVSSLVTLPGGGNGHVHYAGGKLYVSGRGANRIFEVTLEGKVAQIAGIGTAGNNNGDGDVASFNVPNGIHVSNDGSKIYVNDRAVGVGSPLNPVYVRVIEKK